MPLPTVVDLVPAMEMKKKWKKHVEVEAQEKPEKKPVKTKKYRAHTEIRKAMYGSPKLKDKEHGKEKT